MDSTLTERAKRILQAVILDYIETAEPVGSRIISKKYDLALSPATIRNVMADLEEVGLLTQPHTSAGRIPTEFGLRLYVDSILKVKSLSKREKETIRERFKGPGHDLANILKEASRVLSTASKHVGVVLAPTLSTAILKHIEFLKLRDDLILVVFISKSGIIQHKMVELEEDLTHEELDKFSRYLDDLLGDLTLSELREKIIEEMEKEKTAFDEMLSKALKLSKTALQDDTVEEKDVYIEGQANILNYPEFSDIETMRTIFRALEEKSIIIRLLDKSTSNLGVQTFIGSENELIGIEGCSIVISSYTKGSDTLGRLGVIGPTRMDYSKVIPLVDYTARLVGEALAEIL